MGEYLRKIDAMHHYYGRDPQGRKCIDCDHMLSGEYHDKHYYKCIVYGCTHSEATDWRKSYPACGLIGEPFPEHDKRIVDVLKHDRVRKVEQVEGQMEIEIEVKCSANITDQEEMV